MEFFYASALRHYKDAQILKEQGRYDNAVHLYGFAAECALKNLIAVYCDVGTIKKKYGHSGGGIIRICICLRQMAQVPVFWNRR